MKKVIIPENAKGLLFKNGKFEKLLHAGKYYVRKNAEIEIHSLAHPLASQFCPFESLLADPDVAASVATVEIKDSEVALHYVNGQFVGFLSRGKYAFWNTVNTHTFEVYDTQGTFVNPEIPVHLFTMVASNLYRKYEVPPHCKALLFFNNRLASVLDSGTYYFWNNGTRIDTTLVDTRLQQLDLMGQEMLTHDKVTLRVNLVAYYRITDPVKLAETVENYKDRLHTAAQLALRSYVGCHKLDEVLENRDELSAFVLTALKREEATLPVEITDAGVKDVILPGEIRDIMNTVLVAEKQAQANVITRREEVASTRSLLNTAKLMDENETLYKLKELEFIERICENVGNISLCGNGDLLSQLAGVLNTKKT